MTYLEATEMPLETQSKEQYGKELITSNPPHFCIPWKWKGSFTPAQRLGIADRLYTTEDIINSF